MSAEPAGPAWLARAEFLSKESSRWLATAGVIGMIAIAALTVADAVMRWFTVSPINGLNEIVSMVFAAMVVACLPYALAADVQLTIDLLEKYMSARVDALLGAAGALLNLAFFVFVTWHVARYAEELSGEGRITVILHWPQPPFMYALAVLFALASAVQLLVVVRAVAEAHRVLAAPPPAGGRKDVTSFSLVVAALVLSCALGVYAWWDFAALRESVRASPMLSSLAGLLILWLLLLAKMPMGGIMGMVGIWGSIFFLDLAPAMSALGTNVAGFLTNSEVSVLPLFLLMGSLAAVAGMAEDIYRLAHALFCGLRGGLALATIGGCAGFGAVTGSSVATVATIGKVALPEMERRGYSPDLTMGCIAAGGTLGQLVPPSTAIIVYALLTEQSIGQLFVGEVVPAVVAVLLYFITINLFTRARPSAAPPTQPSTSAQILDAARGAIGVLTLFLLVIGGLYSGVFTATESASVGVVVAFAYALVRGKLRPDNFWRMMAESTSTIGMIYILILGAITFSFFIGAAGLPEKMSAWASGLHAPPLALIWVILLIYLFLGCVMDSFGVMIITTPIIAPLVAQVGYDLVWWGVIMVVVVETGMITPPFGLNIFMLKSISNVSLATIYRGVFPFVLADLIKLVLLVLIPATVMWLPSTMYR